MLLGTLLIHSAVAEFEQIETAPTGFQEDGVTGAAADTASIVKGRSVGFRTEGNWKSWIHVFTCWAQALEADGATVVTHLADGLRVGPGAADTKRGVTAWGASVDFAISGLGTCGSCTSYTVVDAITAHDAGARAIAVVTEEFLPHARSISKHLGSPDLPIFVLPHPLEGRSADELDAIADKYYPQIIERVGALV